MYWNHWPLTTAPSRRTASAVLAAVALSLTSLPVANAQPTFGCATPADDMIHLNVSNPGPGDTVPVGNMVLHGLAFDRTAQSSAGITVWHECRSFTENGGAQTAVPCACVPHAGTKPTTNRESESDEWIKSLSVDSTIARRGCDPDEKNGGKYLILGKIIFFLLL